MKKHYLLLIVIISNLLILLQNKNDYGFVSTYLWIISIFFLHKIVDPPYPNSKSNFKTPIYILFFLSLIFLRKIIQDYKQRVDQDVIEVSDLIDKNSQIILFLAPIHKKDQIYYYSRGNIKPETIDQKDLSSISSKYYFLDNYNLDLLNSSSPPKYKIMRQWSNAYDQTIL